MLRIRFKRAGKKRQPSYRIVLMDSVTKRDGSIILWLLKILIYYTIIMILGVCYE